MPETHVTVNGGGQWLTWARGRLNAFNALGLPVMTKDYVMPDGATVRVRKTPWGNYIDLKQQTGGYSITVQTSGYYAAPEYSMLGDIRERDAIPPVPPYTRTNSKFKSSNVTYWVGGTDRAKPKVSHTDLDYGRYVVDGKGPTQWAGPDTLVQVAWIADSGLWIYVTVAQDMKSYSLRGVSPITGVMEVFGTLEVGADGKIKPDDLGIVDVSPDGKKIMFVWSAEDQRLYFRKDRLLREYTITSPPRALPILSTSPTDTTVLDRTVTDSRDDYGYGTTVTESHGSFGYSWEGVLRYATIRDTDTFTAAEPSAEIPTDPETLLPMPGTYSNSGSSATVKREIVVAGKVVRSSTGTGTHSSVGTLAHYIILQNSSGTVYGSYVPSASYTANTVATGHKLLFFDPRSGAYAIADTAGSTTIAASSVGDPWAGQQVTTTRTTTVGPTRVVFYFDSLSKEIELLAARTTSETTGPALAYGPVGTGAFPIYPGLVVNAPIELVRFASRRPGEGVFSFVAHPNKNMFAVIGQKLDKAEFISEDASGLKSYGKAGLKVTQIYPI